MSNAIPYNLIIPVSAGVFNKSYHWAYLICAKKNLPPTRIQHWLIGKIAEITLQKYLGASTHYSTISNGFDVDIPEFNLHVKTKRESTDGWFVNEKDTAWEKDDNLILTEISDDYKSVRVIALLKSNEAPQYFCKPTFKNYGVVIKYKEF